MRDYKNVKVPRKYRTRETRGSVRRISMVRNVSAPAKRRSGTTAALLNVVGFAVIAGCCWTGWQGYRIVTQSEIFQISGMDIRGVQQLGSADLKDIAAEFTGKNIFKVDLEAAARRARLNPRIKEARIHRSLPNRITMSVVERRPYAILDTGACKYLIDSEAAVIERISGDLAEAQRLPVVFIKDYRARPGEPVTAESIAEAFKLIAEIEARGGWSLGGVTVKANSPETISLVYAEHEFRIGIGNYPEKIRRLGEVMSDVRQRNLKIAYVDLRAERQAAVMVSENGRTRGPVARGKGRN